jgi:hypothetical protein
MLISSVIEVKYALVSISIPVLVHVVTPYYTILECYMHHIAMIRQWLPVEYITYNWLDSNVDIIPRPGISRMYTSGCANNQNKCW